MEIKRSYAYNINNDTWTEFSGLDIIRAVILSGGTTFDNINLTLTEDGVLNQYPGNTNTTEDTKVTSKKIPCRLQNAGSARLHRASAEFTGDDTTLKVKTFNPDFTDGESEKEYTDVVSNKPRGIPNANSRCNYFQATIENADTINQLFFEII